MVILYFPGCTSRGKIELSTARADFLTEYHYVKLCSYTTLSIEFGEKLW